MSRVNQFANNSVASTGRIVLFFGFDATTLRLRNDGGGPVYFSLQTTTPSTGDAQLSTGEELVGEIAPASSVALAATSTASSVRVLALGG